MLLYSICGTVRPVLTRKELNDLNPELNVVVCDINSITGPVYIVYNITEVLETFNRISGLIGSIKTHF